MSSNLYQALDREKLEIRLLRIFPSADLNAPIKSDLFELSLTHEPRPEYNALSYVWRDPSINTPITQGQWKAIRLIREYLEDPENPADDSIDPKDYNPDLRNTLMCLCMLVVMQDTSRISLYESPMMHYLAVRGVDKQSQSLRSAFYYTPFWPACCRSAD